MHNRKKRAVYRDLLPKFLNQGLDITPANIKTKMETFRKRYFIIRKEDNPKKLWKHFDKMAEIMEYQGELKESEKPEETSDGISGMAPLLFNGKQYSQDKEASCPRQRHSNADNTNVSNSPILNAIQEKPKHKRRFWLLQEEHIFLDVWEKYLRHLRGARKKTDVYRDMELEFHNQGIEIEWSEIKAKIDTLTRKFRKEWDTVGTDSNWIHYAKVAKLLGALEDNKFNQYSDNSTSSHFADDSCPSFNDNLPLYPQTCLKCDSSSFDSVDSVQPCKTNPSESNADNAEDDSNEIEPRAFHRELLNKLKQEKNS